MHGEYKAPGGKLVAADVTVEANQLVRVSISGDFFLEPDTALETINQALTGLAADTSARELANTIDDALDESVDMIGFAAQDVAMAIRRALGEATAWHDHTFDVIPAVCMHPAQHAALDEVLAETVAQGQRGPTLRLWDWNDSVVVIGSFQSVANEVDETQARYYQTDIVRRVTGGGAMFMEPGNCITYSLLAPVSLIDGMTIEQSYAFLDRWVLGALADVGINAHYEPLNDLVSDQGKIGGAAQKRFANGVVLHHATLAYDMDTQRLSQILRIGREKIADKGISSADKRVDPMRAQTGMARQDIMQAFLDYFQRHYYTRASTYSQQELDRAAHLVESKFTTHDWTYRVP